MTPQGDRYPVQRTIWILTAFYVLSFVDRQILSVLAEPIAQELSLSDTQIGLMSGLAFAFLYTVLGLPLARFADRPSTNRVRLMSICLVLWSGLTALSGAAQNFVQLLFCRVGVGVGEAGCTPAAHSLITDIVPTERRSSAFAIYGLGQPVGAMLGLIIGGLVADALGWRAAFFLVGLPGVVAALLALVLLKEPRRSASTPAKTQIPLGEALRELAGSKAFLHMLAAGSIVAFLAYGMSVWTAIFFIRGHGLSPGQVGLWLGLSGGVAGIGGSIIGGRLADHFGARNAAHVLHTVVAALLVAMPVQLLAYAVGDWRLSMVLLMLPAACTAAAYGPSWATTQGLVRHQLRATAAAVKLFVQALIGIGLGPMLFGMASQQLKPVAGVHSVQWVLMGGSVLLLIPAFHYWRAGRRLHTELKS